MRSKSSMKAKNKHDELQELIIELLRRIAQINMLPPDCRKANDIIAFADKKLGDVVYRIVRTSGVKPSHWILASRDQPLWDEVVAKLCDLKPNIVSTQEVDKMLSDLVWRYKSNGWQLSGITKDAAALIRTIVNMKAETRKVFFPLWGLIVKVSPFVIGNVEFRPRTEYPEIDKALRELKSIDMDSPLFKIHTIAITESSGGDNAMRLQNAEAKVNQALNILRAFLYHTVPDLGLKQVGIMGTFHSLQHMYYYEYEKPHVDTDRWPKYLFGGGWSGIQDIIINEYIIKLVLVERGFSTLNGFLTSMPFELARKLLRGAEWLGEATKPDTLESKFLKVAFAVDAMVGSESEDIPDKGKRARIAQRSAFLLANNQKYRQQVHDEMSSFVKTRDALAHGGREYISRWDTEKFGAYARTILTKLLLHDPPFKTIKELDKWVLQKSFKG